MKLLRFGNPGLEKPGLLDEDGNIRDVSAIVYDYSPAFFAGKGLASLKALDVKTLPIVSGNPRLGPCIAQPGNFIAVGLNYTRHAIETGAAIPSEPIIFNKAPSCISGPNDPVLIPKNSVKTDWEVELALVMGKPAHYVAQADALSYVAGYCVCNDISERAYQLERGSQWVKGKMAPTFGPIGPWLVTSDDVKDVQNLDLWLELNGKRIQSSNTSDMIFSIAELVAYISEFVVLQPGDIITTGTPAGVGLGMKPQVYLKSGDVMQLSVEGLGIQKQTALNWEERPAGFGE